MGYVTHHLRRPYSIPPMLIQWIVRPVTRLLMKFFCRAEVHGLENLKGIQSPVILAPNHLHEFDPVIIPSMIPLRLLPSPLFFVAIDSKYYVHLPSWRRRLYSQWFFKLLGAYEAYLGKHNYAASLVNHERILKDGGSVVIFPEGRMSPDGTLQEAKGGVAYLSTQSGVSVVPVFIDGIWRMTLKDFLLRKRKFIIQIGSPIASSVDHEEFIHHPETLKHKAGEIMNIIKGLKSSSRP